MLNIIQLWTNLGLLYKHAISKGRETPKALSQFPVYSSMELVWGRNKNILALEMLFCRPKVCLEFWNLNVRAGKDLSDNLSALYYSLKRLSSKKYN